MSARPPRRIAVVGGGAGGLSAAYLASRHPDVSVTIFESASQLGGHANTVDVLGRSVDTGFLVYNEQTYTNLCGLFEELHVPTEPSDMSFAVSLAGRSFEWSSDGLSGLFATRSNLASPAFAAMIADMARFNADAAPFLKRCAEDPAAAAMTMREYLDAGKYSAPFRDWYLVPQVAAVWSASADGALGFPARTLLQFCVNHSLVQVQGRPQWRTVSRGSREYVQRIVAALPRGRSTVLVGCRVVSVSTSPLSGEGVVVTDASGEAREFDHVIFGVHPGDAAAMLLSSGSSAAAAAVSALRGFVYADNTAVLHTDPRLMPRRRAAWASWNFIGTGRSGNGGGAAGEPCCVTYWLNRLQGSLRGGVDADGRPFPDLFLTLNPPASLQPAQGKVLRTFSYAHPQYSSGTLEAQASLARVQGCGGLSFVGAYLGYGFHEDAVTSGLRQAHRLVGVRPSWWDAPLYTAPSVWGAELVPRKGVEDPVAVARALRAAGGIYWVDNLGNGGAVGDATRLMADVTAAAAAAAAAAPSPLEKTQGVIGSGFMGDILGHVVTSASDVLATHGLLAQAKGCPSGLVVPAHAGSSGLPALAATCWASEQQLCAPPLVGTSRRLRNALLGSSGSEVSLTDCGSTKSGGAGSSGSDRTSPLTVVVPGGGRPLPLAEGARSPAALRPAAAGAVVAKYAQGHYSGPFAARRVYKSDVVVAAKRVTGARSSSSGSSSSGVFGCSVGDAMSAGVGGYTVQAQAPPAPPPPSSFLSSIAAQAWGLARDSALALAALPVHGLLQASVKHGCILLRGPDGWETCYGDSTAATPFRARMRVHSPLFFLRVAAEADIGLARSFIAGEWTCDDLTALFRVVIVNRDHANLSVGGLWSAWLGRFAHFAVHALLRDNSLAGSRSNISAHYDLSNDLFTSFLDPATMMYSAAFFPTTRRYVSTSPCWHSSADSAPAATDSATKLDASVDDYLQLLGPVVTRVLAPTDGPSSSPVADTRSALATRESLFTELAFHGTLEAAQLRKLDHLAARANVQPTDRVLDLGCGWGGLSMHLAARFGCRVHGITLSREQLALATERVAARGLSHLVTLELVDYRQLAATRPGSFDKILSCEMVEAVGYNYLPTYMAALDALLAPNGVVVLQAITIPEHRWAEYVGSADFINTMIFPGGCLVNTTQLALAAAKANSTLTLRSVDEFGLHYAETLRRWRANFNAVLQNVVRPLGFDDTFIRTWNYYLCYCEAGFASQTLGLQVLTYSRPCNSSIIGSASPLSQLAECLGPFVNTIDTPVVVPYGAY